MSLQILLIAKFIGVLQIVLGNPVNLLNLLPITTSLLPEITRMIFLFVLVLNMKDDCLSLVSSVFEHKQGTEYPGSCLTSNLRRLLSDLRGTLGG